MIAFDLAEDLEFLQDISQIFLKAGESVYFIELVAELKTRLSRNTHEERLKAKPSKRDLEFSHKELLTSCEEHRLNSEENELANYFPEIKTLKIDNTFLSPETVVKQIITSFDLTSKKAN